MKHGHAESPGTNQKTGLLLDRQLWAQLARFILVVCNNATICRLSSAVILQSGSNRVLSTVLYGWNSGQAQYAPAIAVSLMVVLGILGLLAGRLTSHRVEA